MNTLISLICAILIFCIIIVVHEFGHFFAARKCGIDVQEFAIGMGPVIYKKQGRNTLFTVRLLPLGGFCSMGEDEDSDSENSFRKKAVWKRMIVIVAGAVMNLILGFIAGVVIMLISDTYVTTTVAAIVENSGCEKSGMMVGDEIVEMNGMKIFTSGDIVYTLKTDEDGIIDFVVKRNGEIIAIDNVPFTISIDEETEERVLNYDFKVFTQEVTPSVVITQSAKSFAYYARLVLMSVRDLVSGKYGLNNLQGPVGIVSVITESSQQIGFDIENIREILTYFLEITMLISVNLGIFNLLPLPALDGGRFVFLVIEAIRRKAIKAEVEGMVHFIGLALLMLLMIAVTFNDISNIIK